MFIKGISYSFLNKLYWGHWKRKCTSSSTFVGQNLQNLWSADIFVVINSKSFNKKIEDFHKDKLKSELHVCRIKQNNSGKLRFYSKFFGDFLNLVLAGLRLGLKNHQVGEKWVFDDCSYLCKGLSKNYGRILWQENILNQVSYRDTLDFG
jgi:hypothetical protein